MELNGILKHYTKCSNVDYDLIKELFRKFKIELINYIEDFYEENNKVYLLYHYHVLIKKV